MKIQDQKAQGIFFSKIDIKRISLPYSSITSEKKHTIKSFFWNKLYITINSRQFYLVTH